MKDFVKIRVAINMINSDLQFLKKIADELPLIIMSKHFFKKEDIIALNEEVIERYKKILEELEKEAAEEKGVLGF